MLTAALIKRVAPSARADIVQGLVDGWPQIYAAGITTPKRLQHFLSEIALESAGLTRLEENLSYSAQRMCQVWPKRFKSVLAAAPYAHNPRALAEKVYGGRGGNTKPGDGWKYRGGGLLQTTFHDNYVEAGFGDNPDDLRHMPGALTAALHYWTRHRLNDLVDKGDLAAERTAINGATTGIADLRTYVASAGKVIVTIAPPTMLAAAKPTTKAA